MTTTERRTALVSGAGFAGLATAYWLRRLGYRVTVVESAAGLRRGGTPVDLEGETIDVLARMGILDAVRAKTLPPRRLEFKDADDRTVGTFGGEPEPAGARSPRYEIHRDGLLDILFGLVDGKAEMLFGRSLTALENGPDEVTCTFDDGARRGFDLLCGCDGNRSRTRRLAFPDDSTASHFMGGYFFIKVVPRTDLLPPDVSQILSVPGRTALLNGYHDGTDIALAFRTNGEIPYDHRDRAAQRRLVREHFAGLGWKVPAMLAELDGDDDFYFDKLNQIRMARWSAGRVVLVGDAGYCVSPVAGMGGSMAIIGAARLAQALECHGHDHEAAFAAYREGLSPFVREVQERAATEGMAMMFPTDESDIAERDRRLAEGDLEI